jgi:hypothetical protein
MRVTATHRGFYVKLRDPGQEFDVPDALFSPKWMKRVDAPMPDDVAAVVVSPALSQESSETATSTVVKKRRGRRPKVIAE